ncbi:MAG: hypothetical protein RIC19_23205 [Phaeodactylibacter sp.]|uniref:hypothetical protein n=1 Tax=Phaeodactylibacter sp. TaxID=1940289 RepID=UPI0032EFC90E
MARGTVSGELGGGVVGVVGIVVVIAMAPETGIGGVVVVAVVAEYAIVGDSGVRPIEGIVVVMVGKGSGCPVRLRGMATGAVGG